MKTFLAFDDADRENLMKMAPIIDKHGANITDEFYAVLSSNSTTAPLIEGRVERLKTTHQKWLKALAGGDYGEAWCDQQVRIGNVHVAMGISPLHVELTYSLLRDKLVNAIKMEATDVASGTKLKRSVIKALDMSLALVNHAYAEERLNRLSSFTGFSRKLIENCISKKGK